MHGPRGYTWLLNISSSEQTSGLYCGYLLSTGTSACCRWGYGTAQAHQIKLHLVPKFLLFLTVSISMASKLYRSSFQRQAWFESHWHIFGKGSEPHQSLSSMRKSHLSRQNDSQPHMLCCLSWLLGSHSGPRDTTALPSLSVKNFLKNTEHTFIPADIRISCALCYQWDTIKIITFFFPLQWYSSISLLRNLLQVNTFSLLPLVGFKIEKCVYPVQNPNQFKQSLASYE